MFNVDFGTFNVMILGEPFFCFETKIRLVFFFVKYRLCLFTAYVKVSNYMNNIIRHFFLV